MSFAPEEFPLKELINITICAGRHIMEIYNKGDISIKMKKDKTPLTAADKISQEIIIERLKKITPNIPIISEEAKKVSYQERKRWRYFWLVDPLDGTEEFITRNGEFAVNIALIEKDKPVLGVIFAPAKGLIYFAKKTEGAYKLENLQFKNKPNLDNAHRLPLSGKRRTLRVVVSRSHNLKETRKYIEKLKSFYPKIATVSVGSSIKFCLIAEGSADIYFRLGRTMEWDTAAGQIIIEEAGGKIVEIGSKKVLKYNKKTLYNGPFVAYKDKRSEISRLINLFWENQKKSQYN